jgi:murein DD-endopeptidase MepM/ murein hydrolase activator NlpD
MMFATALVSLLGVAQASLPNDELVMAVEIEPGSSFGLIMARYGLPEGKLRELARGVHDLSKIKADRELQLTWVSGEETPSAVRYQLDEDRTLVLERAAAEWSVRVETIAFASDVRSLSLVVAGSLWRTLADAGLRPRDIARLNETLEFHPGDRLTLVGDVRVSEGRAPWLGDLHALRFEGSDRTVEAVRFVHLDGTEDWYSADGKSLRGAFLRSPLEFSEVSSGFSKRRFHPILRVSRPHNGTDFAAVTGTPVRTVADGVVVAAGYNGGHGYYVEIQHDDEWATSYSHLSRVGVRRGQKVRQGDFIGKVGSTGLATGPHLHYQMWRRGAFVDAMRVELPLQKTLQDDERSAFAALATLYGAAMDGEQVTSLRTFVLGGG